jgi:hypothetical protein
VLRYSAVDEFWKERQFVRCGPAWIVVSTIVGLVLWLSAAAVAAQTTTADALAPSATPRPGTREREALIAAVRDHVGLAKGTNRLRVHHLKVSGRWAYFAGNEIVHVQRAEWQETDLSIEALLERDAGHWRVVEYWSLPTEERNPRHAFERRVKDPRERAGIPITIFPQPHER